MQSPEAPEAPEAPSITDITQSHLASLWGVPKDRIRVFESAQKMPDGLTYVRVREKGGPDSEGEELRRTTGLVKEERFITGWADCAQAMLEAWNYGPERTVSATTFAVDLDQFHGRFSDSPVVVVPDTTGRFPLIAPPSEIEVDGLPGVTYWADTTPEHGDFMQEYSRITVTVGADYTPTLQSESYHDVAKR